MSRQRRRTFEVESLEGKLLLNASPIMNGTYNSNVKYVQGTGTTIATITEPFSGTSKSFGRVKGTITEVVNTTSGTLTSANFLVQNAKGSVQLNFTENDLISNTSTKKANSEVLAYTVSGGTGQFANATGTGTFTMVYTIKGGAVQIKLHTL